MSDEPLTYPDATAALKALLAVLPAILKAAWVAPDETQLTISAVTVATGEKRTLKVITLQDMLDAAKRAAGQEGE